MSERVQCFTLFFVKAMGRRFVGGFADAPRGPAGARSGLVGDVAHGDDVAGMQIDQELAVDAPDHLRMGGEQAIQAGRPGRAEGAPTPELGEFDLVVDAGVNAEYLRQVLTMLKPEGHCESVGIYFFDDVPMPLFQMYLRGVTFHTGVDVVHISAKRIRDVCYE